MNTSFLHRRLPVWPVTCLFLHQGCQSVGPDQMHSISMLNGLSFVTERTCKCANTIHGWEINTVALICSGQKAATASFGGHYLPGNYSKHILQVPHRISEGREGVLVYAEIDKRTVISEAHFALIGEENTPTSTLEAIFFIDRRLDAKSDIMSDITESIKLEKAPTPDDLLSDQYCTYNEVIPQ